MEISLVTDLANAYDFDSGMFENYVVEEYIIKHGKFKGQIDVPYLCRKERISHKRVRDEIKKVFGKDKFPFESDQSGEVSKQQFLEHYEFGEYPNVREWIGHLYRATGKTITREKLFQYLTEDNVDQRWEVQPHDSFV